jgi:hypothetical protein
MGLPGYVYCSGVGLTRRRDSAGPRAPGTWLEASDESVVY